MTPRGDTFWEKDMYPYVKRNLRKRYPKYKGWEIYQKDRWRGFEPDFVVERRNRRGNIERVVVEVKLTCKVSSKDVRQLNSYVRNLAGRNVRILEKILTVPSGTDISEVPDDINVMFLRSFKCEDDEIIWYEY